MIGKIMMGKSFKGCISYCLEDKRNSNAVHNRAEVLQYNLCFGDKRELAEQFNDVRNLNPRLAKPVLHITLSLSPGERLTKEQLTEMAEECAQEFGFQGNQYIAVEHRDTSHQHIHLVVNRVGFNGKTLSDSNNFKRMALFCRKMELKFGLRQVLSPRSFLPRDQRYLPRLAEHKKLLRQHVQASLTGCFTFGQFQKRMQEGGYSILKGRGISFTDPKGTRTKGSDVGYSLRTIESILCKQQLQEWKKMTPRRLARVFKLERPPETKPSFAPFEAVLKGIGELLDMILRVEYQSYTPIPWQLRTTGKKKKKKRRSL